MRCNNVITILSVLLITFELTNALGLHWTDYMKPGLQRVNGKRVQFPDKPYNYRLDRPINEEEAYILTEQVHGEEEKTLTKEDRTRRNRLLNLLKELLPSAPQKRSIRSVFLKLKPKIKQTN